MTFYLQDFTAPTDHPLEIFDLTELIPSIFDFSGAFIGILVSIYLFVGAAKITVGYFKKSF